MFWKIFVKEHPVARSDPPLCGRGPPGGGSVRPEKIWAGPPRCAGGGRPYKEKEDFSL